MQMYKTVKRIFIVMLICMAIFILFETKAKAYTRAEVQTSIVKVAKEIINIGNKNKILKYNNQGSRESIYDWKLSGGRLQGDCGSFCGAVYRQVFSRYIGSNNFLDDSPVNVNLVYRAFNNYKTIGGMEKGEYSSNSVLQPGDVLVCPQGYKGHGNHAAIYLGGGKTAEAMGQASGMKLGSASTSRFQYYYRVTDQTISHLTHLNSVLDWKAIRN